MHRGQLEPLLEDAKTESNLVSHFSFLARRQSLVFRPFKETRARDAELPVFAGREVES